jgi:tetratricopeptide (TPR) repeat protein
MTTRTWPALALGFALCVLAGCGFDGEQDARDARLALHARQPDQAVRLATRALRFGGLSPRQRVEALMVRAEALLVLSQCGRAVEDLGRLLALEPGEASGLFLRAGAWLDCGDPARALGDADQGLALLDPQGNGTDPVLASRYGLRCRAALVGGDLGRALADAERAVALSGFGPAALGLRAEVFERSGLPVLAVADLERAVWLLHAGEGRLGSVGRMVREAEFKARLIVLGEALAGSEAGDLLAPLDAAVAANPREAKALLRRGVARSRLGNFAGAVEDLGQALALDPDNPEALLRRAAAHLALERNAAALADLDRLVALAPPGGSADALSARAKVLARLGRGLDADRDLGRVLDLRPGDAEAYAGRGLLRIRAGQAEAGCADLRAACGLGLCEPLRAVRGKNFCQ